MLKGENGTKCWAWSYPAFFDVLGEVGMHGENEWALYIILKWTYSGLFTVVDVYDGQTEE